MITNFKIFENDYFITIPDVSWLYFLHYIYNGKLKMSSWENDKRMFGTICKESLSKFDCVMIKNGYFISNSDCEKIINDYFGSKSFEKSIIKKQEFIEYNDVYDISNIPYELFLKKQPNIQKAFDRISDKIVDHFNSQRSLQPLLEKMIKMRQIKKWNFKTMYDMVGNIPNYIKIYRGLKNGYDPNMNKKYTCWTLNYNQAERFAKYKFTGSYQNPIYSPNPIILESTVKYDDILMVVGGDEYEVIMGEVEIENIKKL